MKDECILLFKKECKLAVPLTKRQFITSCYDILFTLQINSGNSEAFLVSHSDMYKLKESLRGVSRKKLLLKFQNMKGDK